MLQKIRDNSQGIGAKIFVWFIIVIFGAWGASSIVSTVINGTPVVSVNGTDIDELEVESNTQARIQELITSLGADTDLSGIDEGLVREGALNELIQRELLLQYAVNSGMVISSISIDRGIAQIADFQVNGAFNGERAQLLINGMGYTPNSYRAALASQGLINQTSSAYGLSGFVTKPEIEHLAKLLNQTRDLRYLLISREDQFGNIEISDEEIDAYYASNELQFMQEEQLSLEYIEINKVTIFDEVTVAEDEILRRYNEEQKEYQSQIERRASHILLEAFDDEGISEAISLAEQLKDRIDNGESFESLALEYSSDTGSAENGGDVGYTSGDNFVEPFEQALLSLEIGDVSGPVQTEFGVHLIKLIERSESAIESLEGSRERIESDLKTVEVDTIFLERAEELGNLAFESFDLVDPAEIMGLEIQTSDLFDRSGGTGIAANDNVINTAFSTQILIDALNSDLISVTPSRNVVIRLLEHNQPQLQSIDEVRGEIDVLLQFDKIRQQTIELGESIRDSYQNGQNIDSLLELQGLSWNQINTLERTDPVLPPELVQNVFTMPVPKAEETVIDGFLLSSGQYVVIELQGRNDGSLEEFDGTELEGLKSFLSGQAANADFEALVIGLENRAEIIR